MAGAGAVDADEDLAPEPSGDLPQGRARDFPVVGEGVRAFPRIAYYFPLPRGDSS